MCNGPASSLRKASIHSRDEPNRLGHQLNESCLCQALEGKVKSAIAEAKQVLISSDKADGSTADKLQRASVKLQKAVESVRSAGLSTSHPLVKAASQLGKPLRDKGTKIKVSALHVV